MSSYKCARPPSCTFPRECRWSQISWRRYSRFFSIAPTANEATLARRLAIATAWLAHAWRNTESIRAVERSGAFPGCFLWLGTFGFGGPIATVGYMQRDLVGQRRWLAKPASSP